MYAGWGSRCSGMSPDSLATRSDPCGHVAPCALVYHRFRDGALTDNSPRSLAAPGRPRPEDLALLVARRRVRRGRRWTLARVCAHAAPRLHVVVHAVLSGAHPVAAPV